MNITELARKLKTPTKELKEKLPALGFAIGLRAIKIPDEQAEKVIIAWQAMKKRERLEKEFLDRKEKTPEIVEKKEKIVLIPEIIRVNELAAKLNLSVVKIISELMKNGVVATINDNLDFEIAAIIAENLGFQVKKIEKEEMTDTKKEHLKELLKEEKITNLKPRPPVVVVMGHVDHGKTTLLDRIRQTNVAAEEAGQITQKIGAYQVTLKKRKVERQITFIDTPGHGAFKAMRSQGGKVADLAILVIDTTDKIQPQTIEALEIIQKENLPFIVALNKIDRKEADPDRIKKELVNLNVVPEDWGGKVICQEVSAKTGDGIEELIEMVDLVADLEKERLLVNFNRPAIGTVIESRLDKGEGVLATVIIHTGTLKVGDLIIVGLSYGKIRLLRDWQGKPISRAQAGMPIQISGLKNIAKVGEILEVVDEKTFKERLKEIILKGAEKIIGKVAREEKNKEKVLNIILRADLLGELKAISESIEKIKVPGIRINLIKKELGNITETDIDLAKSMSGIIIGFNVEISPEIKSLAEESQVEVNIYQIIYHLLEDVEKKAKVLLPKEIIERPLGKVKIIALFHKKGKEMIVGTKVFEGEVLPKSKIRVWRNGKLIGKGEILELQINRKDVEKAPSGSECGIRYLGDGAIELNDELEIYKEEVADKDNF